MAINQTITTIPTAGQRGVQVRDDFVASQEAFQDALSGVTVDELNTFATEANSTATQVNTDATTATTKASEASTSASNAATSESNAATSESNAATSAAEAQDYVANIPDGAINDTITSTTNTWSSDKIDTEKASLAGATFTGLVAYDDTAFTANIDCSLGNSFSITATADFTQTFSNVPATGTACVIVLKLTDAGTYIVTWDTTIKWAGGVAPTLTATGTDSVVLYTIDGGVTWHGNANIGYA